MKRHKILTTEAATDRRFGVALLCMLAGYVLASLARGMGSGAWPLSLIGVFLALYGASYWLARPSEPGYRIPYHGESWDEHFIWHVDGRALKTETGYAIPCPVCGRTIPAPEHLEVNECRCGLKVGSAGAGGSIRYPK
jgi:hypothetical protein